MGIYIQNIQPRDKAVQQEYNQLIADIAFNAFGRIQTKNAEVTHGSGVEFKEHLNAWEIKSPIAYFRGGDIKEAYIKVTTNIQLNPLLSYTLHLSTTTPGFGNAPEPLMDIEINGKSLSTIRISNQRVYSYQNDDFDITHFLVDGDNEIVIRQNPNSMMDLDVHHLQIQSYD